MKSIANADRLRLVESGSEAVLNGATWIDKAKSRLRERIGILLNRRRLPGAVQPMSLRDPLTGNLVEVELLPLFTRFSVNGRHYYFERLSGHFDGTGMGCG